MTDPIAIIRRLANRQALRETRTYIMTDPVATSIRHKKPKAWRTFHFVVSALPLTWAVLMCVYSLYAYASLGHWPRPMVDDRPHDTFADFLENSTGILLLLTPFTFFIWCVLSIWQWKHSTLRQNLWQIGLYAVGVAACLVFAWANPGKFFEWWLD